MSVCILISFRWIMYQYCRERLQVDHLWEQPRSQGAFPFPPLPSLKGKAPWERGCSESCKINDASPNNTSKLKEIISFEAHQNKLFPLLLLCAYSRNDAVWMFYRVVLTSSSYDWLTESSNMTSELLSLGGNYLHKKLSLSKRDRKR